MSKIDPNKKPTTSLTPDAETLSDQLQSAADYTKRIKAKQAQTRSAKSGDKAVGGPPIPEGKMQSLMPMAQPSWGDEDEHEGGFSPPETPRQVHQPPSGGVGSGYEVNQALSGGGLKEPITVAQSKARGMGMVSNKQVSSDQPIEPQAQVVQEAPVEEPEPEEPEDAPDFNFDELGDARLRLISKERREAIESRLKPLNVSDLITTNEIRQTVPSIPGQLEYELRTISEHEHLYCMQYVYDYTGSQRYVEELFNTAKIACSVVAVNGKMLPDHRKNVGQRNEEVDKELFSKKVDVVKRFATQLLADIGVQLTWFNERVNQLFSVERIKNG